MGSPRPVRIGVLVSGNGTNLQALIDAVLSKALNAEISIVISNRPDAAALSRARKAGIPNEAVFEKDFRDRDSFEEEMVGRLLEKKVDLVVLAGFMRILSPAFLRHFPGRVVNVHPALLPEDPLSDKVELPDGTFSDVFRGKDAVKQALEAGVGWSGCSIHLVTERVDAGPLLAREPVQVLPGDTVEFLHRRIQEAEHRLLPRAIEKYGARVMETGRK